MQKFLLLLFLLVSNAQDEFEGEDLFDALKRGFSSLTGNIKNWASQMVSSNVPHFQIHQLELEGKMHRLNQKSGLADNDSKRGALHG